jgi:hypothetical protein
MIGPPLIVVKELAAAAARETAPKIVMATR